ncbi:TadE/TadG family type IV pilus assembly protein [Nocardioides nitrophenolicus]|uniref:TadE/TadG family type IV pilus assembly protein n=1 Tax=Nocardioides nitrophenolicus TaxID=60489 RepID=UPI001959536E|nr:TadE/TadG family type IV pilus assembly protein [Nocardioides nitrophenolicus]MBM7516015.1 Flp pilus assembly protein TadG [Nocardioides nitrophenolicus]
MSRRRTERGSALVDVTLAAVVLVPLLLGLVQVALVLHVRTTLAAAAAEGARLAATADREPGDGVARARAQIAAALAPRYADDVAARRVLVEGSPGIEIVVRAEVPALGVGGPAVAVTVTGRAVLEDPR